MVIVSWGGNRDGAFFFFKQKTAYEIMPSLVGSEMCIRDRFIAMEAIVMLVDGLHVGTLKIILDRLTHSTLTSILPLQLKK